MGSSGFGGGMAKTNPTFESPKLIKIEADQFHKASMEREKNMIMEMGILARERDLLKKEVDFLERSQKYMELEKFSVEEKLGRSERRCEELEAKIKKLRQKKLNIKKNLNRSLRKCRELRRKEIAAESTNRKRDVDELRVEKMDFGEPYKRRLDDLAPIVKEEKEEENLNTRSFVENGKAKKANEGDRDAMSPEIFLISDDSRGDGGIKASKKGGRIEDKGANVATYSASKRAYVSNVAASNGSVQDNEVDWPENRGATFRALLQRRCNLIKITNGIKKNLDKENLKRFEESCFGHLLKANEFTFQGQLIVQLLEHMDMSASNEKRLVFIINNSTTEFGPREFFHVTGLQLGELETTTTTQYSTIHQSFFGGRPTITLKDIEKAFLNISTSREGKGELTLKLALLKFLYGTLLAKSKNTKIEVQYLHLTEDLQKFNAFPWGQLGYEYLVSSILEARIGMDTRKVDIHGFSDALQAWAYEMMPSVAAQCASCLNDFEKITPWILRWSATRVFRSKDLKKFFAPVDLEQKNTEGKKKEETIPKEANQKKRKFLCEGSDPVLHAQPSYAATPPPPSMDALTYPHHHSRRLSLHKEVDEPVLDDNLPRNETPLMEDEETMKEAELPTSSTRHSISDPKPISIDKATDNLERSLLVTERNGALSELANDNPVLDAPLLSWKENSDEISETDYGKTKASYERLLNRTKRLKLWITYAKFEAFGIKEKSDFSEKRKCLERARAVFERGLSYFRTHAPELIEDRTELLEEWYKIEKYFGKLGNENLVRAKMPRKLKKIVPVQNEDGTTGYVEHIEYLIPEEKTDDTFESTSKR